MGPLGCACLIYHQCAMSPLQRFTLYCGLAPKNGPVLPAFFSEAPGPFPCPLLQGNSVGGWRQALPPGLSEPWLPTGYPSSMGHPVSSPTILTRAPGAVRHPSTAAFLAHCHVVLYPTVPGHCLYRQTPTATSGERHSPIHLHTR